MIGCYLLGVLSFLTGDRKEVGLEVNIGGAVLGGVQGEKSLIRVYYIRKNFFP